MWRSSFEKGEVIHAVFISHLDEDHINGIPYLLKYCKVKNIFFPLITRKHAKYIKLYNVIKYGGVSTFLADFLENPYAALGKLEIEEIPRLYQIGEGEERDNGVDAETILSGVDVADIIFGGTHKKSGLYREWVYIPYNFRQEDRVKQLQTALNTLFHRDMTNADLHEIWKRGIAAERELVKEAYRQVKGSFNTNSMTLYSGVRARGLLWQSMDDMNCRCFRHCGCNAKEAGCLFTGDYDASGAYKWRDLEKAYRTYWDNIGCVQVPHHGSRHNYNTELAKMDAFYIISAGKNNTYRHPHSMVIRDLLFGGHVPYIVTEDNSSRVYLVIHR